MSEIICKKCEKKFRWQIVGTIYPGGKDREDIDCPYCGENNGYRMTSALVSIEKIDEDWQVSFIEQ